jgi:uncharacterized protein (TIGR00251 family)
MGIMRHPDPPPATGNFTLAVKVVPGAPYNRIMGLQGTELVIKITTAPEKGKANKALIAFLAAQLGIPKSSIVILRGKMSHHKLLQLPEIVRERIKGSHRGTEIQRK